MMAAESQSFSLGPDLNGKRIGIHAVRNLCGNVSSMTIYRWLNSPEMNFPKPIYIGRLRYWKEADLLTWLDAREVRA